MTYTTNSSEQLEFSEADMETLQMESMDLEGLESLFVENLESIDLENVAEDVEYYMVEDTEGCASSSYMTRQLTKVFTCLVKKAVKKITTNPKTRSKLEAACRQGPNSVAKLITPIVAKPLPGYLRFLATIFCPPIVARLFPAISKEAGLKSEELEAWQYWAAGAAGWLGAKLGWF